MVPLALSSVRPRRTLVWLVGALCATAAMVAPAAAGGDPNPHESVSSVSQYVEDVPTADGPVAAGVSPAAASHSSPPPPPVPLPARVERAIERSGGQDGRTLKDIATQPALGAQKPSRATRAAPEALGQPSVAAAVSSATSGGGTAVTVALVLMALVTLAAVGLAVRRARR